MFESIIRNVSVTITEILNSQIGRHDLQSENFQQFKAHKIFGKVTYMQTIKAIPSALHTVQPAQMLCLLVNLITKKKNFFPHLFPLHRKFDILEGGC